MAGKLKADADTGVLTDLSFYICTHLSSEPSWPVRVYGKSGNLKPSYGIRETVAHLFRKRGFRLGLVLACLSSSILIQSSF